jgi:hypothetical protein
MEPDEILALMVSASIASIWTAKMVARLATLDSLVCPALPRAVYVGALTLCAVTFGIALATVTAASVHTDLGICLLFFFAWLAAVAGATTGLGLLGIDAMDDGIERKNPAVRVVAIALWIAVTISAIGANIGEGDFVGTALMPMMLSIALIVGLCGIFVARTSAVSSIASDRDRPAGFRLAGLMIAWGVLFGRAGAGDWISAGHMLRKFGTESIAAAALLIIAIWLERRQSTRPQPQNIRAHGIFPAIVYLGLATIAALSKP